MKKYFSPVPVILAAVFCFAWQSASAGEVVLQDDQLSVAFDSDSGALTRLEDKTTHWVIERRPKLGVSFQMNVLRPDRSSLGIRGSKQPAVAVTKVSDQEVRLQWKDLLSESGETLPITLTSVVTLTNGALTFAATVENNSSLMIESVDYPYLGDLNNAPDGSLKAKHMWYGDLKSGDISPSHFVESKQSLFCLIQSPGEGLYVEMQDPTQPYLLRFAFNHRETNKSVSQPAHEEFRTTHLAYVHPHTTMKLAPVVLRGYQGDWHAGVDRYKEWRATWFKEPHLPAWAKEVHAWTMLRMNTTEDDFTIPYTNFVAYGEEYASNGVKAVQLVGWNKGGQDGGDPVQDTDPGLGTWQEFHDAIARVQALGVKVILFGKLNWADLTTAWYTNELYRFQCTDQNGQRYEQGGYAYVTPTQLAGIGLHRRAVMDFMDPEYREVATKEFKKILALGAEGWLWDEVCHHATVLYSWAPNHGYTPPGYVYGGDLPLSAQLRAAADQVSPDFIFSGEGPEDWLMQYFPVSETGVTAIPICQYIDRHCLMLAGVSGFDDREQLNMILLHRYVIQYEPFFYKGHLSDFPLTLAYGKKIDVLRRQYKAFLWDGEFRDTLGATVSADGAYRYSVFIAAGGKRAVVVINPESDKSITATVALPNLGKLAGKLVVATPEQPDAAPTDGTLKIPARSAAVIMEE
jgi:hypothetical protein